MLHRNTLLRARAPFQSLGNVLVRDHFESQLALLVARLEFKAVTITLDKRAYEQRFGEWRQHPYHLCLEILLERFVMFLREQRGIGRVILEARGRVEDEYAANSMDVFYRGGNRYIDSREMELYFPQPALRIRSKEANVAGLQIADIVVYPSFLGMMHERFRRPALHGFVKDIFDVLDDGKYREKDGVRKGYGTKWLPG